jgi:hypothetical protein
VLIVASTVLVGCLLAFRDLPMVDLPQHAAQLTTLLNWSDPSYSQNLELNPRTPYLLAYCFAWLFAQVFGVAFAWKLVVALAVVGNAWALTLLARRLGHSPWLALLGLPTAVGYSFYFGFVSFLLAVPLGIATIPLALAHAERPRLRSGLAYAGLTCLVLFAHGVAFAMACAASVPLLLRGEGSWVKRTAPLLAPLVFGLAWLLSGSSMQRMGVDIWGAGLIRLAFLPAALVGVSARDVFATAFGVAILVSLALSLGRPEPRIERWSALAMALVGYCFFPAQLRGYGFIADRFACFVLPAALLAFRPSSSGTRRATPWVFGGLTLAWLTAFAVRLATFNGETAALHRLLRDVPAGLQLRALIFDRESRAFAGAPLFLHLPAMYFVEKGGRLAHSFAVYPNSVVRLRPGKAPSMPLGAEWHPDAFDISREGAHHDYYVVKIGKDPTERLFGRSPVQVTLDARHGDFWGYRSRPAPIARDASASGP